METSHTHTMTNIDLQVLLLRFAVSLLGLLDEETMVTALLQLHDYVEEARGAAPCALGEGFVVPRQNPPGNTCRKSWHSLLV